MLTSQQHPATDYSNVSLFTDPLFSLQSPSSARDKKYWPPAQRGRGGRRRKYTFFLFFFLAHVDVFQNNEKKNKATSVFRLFKRIQRNGCQQYQFQHWSTHYQLRGMASALHAHSGYHPGILEVTHSLFQTTCPPPSSETQGQSVGPGEKARRKFSSTGGRTPGYRLSPDRNLHRLI